MYTIKEIFATLQGEGAQTGRAAVFLRFAGCNLWSGLEKDRADARCKFCDTDFVGADGIGGGKYEDADAVADKVLKTWPSQTAARRYVVCTGGEPLLQLDAPLITALKARGFTIAIETNGSLSAPEGIDWICVSPKGSVALQQTSGDELKLVYPQEDCPPPLFEDLPFTHFFLQPMDGPDVKHNIDAAAAYCLSHPKWRLSLQTHKMIGLP